jgi:hypothetical protein
MSRPEIDDAVRAILDFAGWDIGELDAFFLSGYLKHRYGLTADDQRAIAQRFGEPASVVGEEEPSPTQHHQGMRRCPVRWRGIR